MEEAKRLSIHVAVRNDVAFLRELVESLRAQTFRDFQMTVIGGERDSVVAQDSGIVWLRNFHWRGFARSHNQAIALALSRYPRETWDQRFVAIMHPDVVLDPHALQRIVEAFVRDPHLMAATPKVLCARSTLGDDMESRQIEPTDRIEEIGVALTRLRRRKGIGAGETDRGQWEEPADVVAASDCCAFFRASALAAMERKGMWLNERISEERSVFDLSWRCHKRNMRVQTCPGSVVWHLPHPASSDGVWAALGRWFK